MRRWLVFLVIVSAAASAGAEHRVRLANGRDLLVIGIEERESSWRFELASGGVLEIERAKVQSVIAVEAESDVLPVPPVLEAPPAAFRPTPRPELLAETPYDDWIAGLAARHGIEPLLVRAVILAESRFDDTAASRAGALGLMQLMPATARDLGCSNRLDPVANMDCGIRYLKQMIDAQGGDLELALAAYNAGPAAVRRYGGVPPYPETRAYVRRILGWLGLAADRSV